MSETLLRFSSIQQLLVQIPAPKKHLMQIAIIIERFSCAGSAIAMIGANLRYGIGTSGNVTSNATKVFQCHPGGVTEATVIFSLGALGMGANIILMALILTKRQLRRYEMLIIR